MKQVEYTGHTIDAEGISFSAKKISKAVEFRKPTTQKEMKSFLGFANYFRDHIVGYAEIVRPLHAMITKYKPESRLQYSDETNKAFDAIKLAINDCPTLLFIDTTSPIHMNTDASRYGAG
jgi:hypothetical protein